VAKLADEGRRRKGKVSGVIELQVVLELVEWIKRRRSPMLPGLNCWFVIQIHQKSTGAQALQMTVTQVALTSSVLHSDGLRYQGL